MIMPVRGIRGATTIAFDQQEEIITATSELLEQMQRTNSFSPEEIAAVLFTVTSDIHSIFPARAARNMGWQLVPLMCFKEIEAEESLPLCIRILILWNTDLNQNQIKHIYLHGAEILRPDLKAE